MLFEVLTSEREQGTPLHRSSYERVQARDDAWRSSGGIRANAKDTTEEWRNEVNAMDEEERGEAAPTMS